MLVARAILMPDGWVFTISLHSHKSGNPLLLVWIGGLEI